MNVDSKTIQSIGEKIGYAALLALVLWWMGGKADLFLTAHLSAMTVQTEAIKSIDHAQRESTDAQKITSAMLARFMDGQRDPRVYETTATNDAIELIAEQVDRVAKASGTDTSDLLARVKVILERNRTAR